MGAVISIRLGLGYVIYVLIIDCYINMYWIGSYFIIQKMDWILWASLLYQILGRNLL